MKKTLYLCIFTLPLLAHARTRQHNPTIQDFFDEIEQSFNESIARFERFFADDDLQDINNNLQQSRHSFRNQSVRVISNSLNIETEKKDDTFIVKAIVPGFQKGEVKAEIEQKDNNYKVLTILAESQEEKTEKQTSTNNNKSSSSLSYKKIQKSISLPENVDITNYEASHKDGIFMLTFKLKEEEPSKKITITVDPEESEKE